MLTRYRIRHGEEFLAESPEQVVAYLAKTSRVEFPSLKSWMLDCADRIDVQVGPGTNVSIDTPERFVADLVSIGLLTIEPLPPLRDRSQR